MASQTNNTMIVDRIYRNIAVIIKKRNKDAPLETCGEIQEMLDMAMMILKENKPSTKKRKYKKKDKVCKKIKVGKVVVVLPVKNDQPCPVLA